MYRKWCYEQKKKRLQQDMLDNNLILREHLKIQELIAAFSLKNEEIIKKAEIKEKRLTRRYLESI
tara:strand:- start:4103 stop:4297 length:195 start_codon:yes stop_codon:yes gene_type:complete